MRGNRLQLGIVPQPTGQSVHVDTQRRGRALALFVREQHRPYLRPPQIGQNAALRPEQTLSRLLRQTHATRDITRATPRGLAPGSSHREGCGTKRCRIVDVIKKTRWQGHPLGTCGLSPRYSHRRWSEWTRPIDGRREGFEFC